MTPDTINGCFEFGMATFAARSIYILHHDKRVRGISWGMIVFAMLWGYWNLFYYPSLGQWFSFTGGAVLCACNTTWVCQALYWIRREKLFYEMHNDGHDNRADANHNEEN